MGIQDLQTVRLDINNKYDIELTCKQLDDIILKIIIYDKSLKADLSNYTCRLKAFKADQVPLIQNSNITIDGNIVTIKANSQLTTTAGVVKAELQFINKTTSEKKSTFYLNIEVVASSLYVDSGLSTPTITLLQELDNKLDQIENIGTVLDEAITVKSELETNISTATKTKSDLATINTNATTTKNDLETLNTNAIQTKSDLDSANVLAGDNKSDLDIKNALATQNIQQMDSFGDVSTLVQNVTELKADKTEILNTIGDETIGTTATTLKGAIKEVKGIADNNTTQLNDLAQNANKIWNKEVLTFVPTVDYSLIYNESYKVGNLIIINAAIKRTDESIINGNFNVGIFQGIKNNNIKLLSTTSHSTTTVSALNSANSKGLIGISGDVWVSITGTNDTKGVVISTVFVEGGN
nr:viral A-type inclusion protein [Clostridium neonatale]DAW06020.1 MAG TPA: BppU domain protein [Caudoviricetes sp.]